MKEKILSDLKDKIKKDLKIVVELTDKERETLGLVFKKGNQEYSGITFNNEEQLLIDDLLFTKYDDIFDVMIICEHVENHINLLKFISKKDTLQNDLLNFRPSLVNHKHLELLSSTYVDLCETFGVKFDVSDELLEDLKRLVNRVYDVLDQMKSLGLEELEYNPFDPEIFEKYKNKATLIKVQAELANIV